MKKTAQLRSRVITMAKRRRGRDVNGILVLDKPQGISSNDAVQRAKRLFNAKKVGHTGGLIHWRLAYCRCVLAKPRSFLSIC